MDVDATVELKWNARVWVSGVACLVESNHCFRGINSIGDCVDCGASEDGRGQ